MYRRRVLQCCAVLTAGALAGCSDDDATDRSPTTSTPVGSTTRTTTRTGTATTATETDLPAYADPDAYTERTLSLPATDDCSLGATLSLPDGDGDVPGVVVVHGSGPGDRDGTVGPLRPYRDLAVGLATGGVATLRYDKRTSACSFGIDATELTIDDEVTDDALSAIDRLRAQDRVDGVVVAGHSLGGMLGPRIAAREGDLAGIAMLAPPARSLPELIVAQRRYEFERDGDLTDDERERLARIETIADRVAAGDVDDEEVIWGGGRPYWQSLADYDQIEATRRLDVPILLQQGLGDEQVPPETELPRWREALADRDATTIRTYEGLNHFLVEGPGPMETGRPPEPGFVSEAVVADLATWTTRVAGSA